MATEIRYGGRSSGKVEAQNKWLCSHEPGSIKRIECDTKYRSPLVKIEIHRDPLKYYLVDDFGIKNEIEAPTFIFNKPWEENHTDIYKLLNIHIPI